MPHTARAFRRFCFGTSIAVVLSLCGCRGHQPWVTLASPVASGSEQLAFKATVHYMAFEGGFHELFADAGPDYDPLNLPPQFQRDGLRVDVVVQLRPDMGGWHAAGPRVTILRIRALRR
jgi:hypothetical protein